jgi:hypothetical protein
MNERIKELAEQAGIEFTYDPTEVPMRAFVEAWEGDLEKFAELIIAECTQVLFDEAERLNGLSSEETNLIISNDLESCAEKCMDNIVRIEEHFGVK